MILETWDHNSTTNHTASQPYAWTGPSLAHRLLLRLFWAGHAGDIGRAVSSEQLKHSCGAAQAGLTLWGPEIYIL